MTAALTIAVLFALSSVIVRVASTVIRHTGLPQNVARLQCISALSGTGFTTRESELIVNHPIRRRVLTALIVLGNLGFASLATTFIVAFVTTDQNAHAIVFQIVAFICAISITFLIVSSKTLDDFLCRFVSRVLARSKTFVTTGFWHLIQFDETYSVAEHEYSASKPKSVSELPKDSGDITVLAIRESETDELRHIQDVPSVSTGDVLICFGNKDGHDALQIVISGFGARVPDID